MSLDVVDTKQFDDRKGLELYRREELWRTCRAYGLPYNEKWRKDRLVQEMEFARADGRMKELKHPEYLQGWPTKVSTEEPIQELSDDTPLEAVFCGPQLKYCVMQGNVMLHQKLSKAEAEDIVNGVHVPTGG